ncbi:hypothetical protein PIROE2DRAFT_60869 [Piromyces sp. E2]|nr:hypothetical protein PIROE2DRAFT_60869 [Piromyces sp. E2]|eukprot:OUM64138.1 hypothetical protein PIROE2DRAFT_60869 [Piromyces sp. E2]
MQFLYSTYLLIILFGFVQVFGLGYHCKKYIVLKNGDRCSHITTGFELSNKFHITRDKLYRFNPSLDCNNLKSGTKVCVEVNENFDDDDNDFQVDTVEPKDNCASIAKRLKAPIPVIAHTNEMEITCTKKGLKNIEGMPLLYREDGKYEPIFKNAKQIKLNNTNNKNNKKGFIKNY